MKKNTQIPQSIHYIVGKNIRKAREEIGLTQDELGKKTQLSRVSINAIENGRRTQLRNDSIRRIALALNKPEIYFYGNEVDFYKLIPELKPSISMIAALSAEQQKRIIPAIKSILDIIKPIDAYNNQIDTR